MKPRLCKRSTAWAIALLALLPEGAVLPVFAQKGPEIGNVYGPAEARLSDEEIRRRVSEALQVEPYGDRQDVQVHVTDGVVRLSGEVESRLERFHLVDSARKVKGVQEVHSDIQVRAP